MGVVLRANNNMSSWTLGPFEITKCYLILSAAELRAIVSVNLQRLQIENITLCIYAKCNQSLSDRPLNWNKSHEAGKNHRHWAWLCHLIGLKRIPIYGGWLIAPFPQIKECGVCPGPLLIIAMLTASCWDCCWFAKLSHLLLMS